MLLTLNAEGKRKKELVKALEEINNVKAKYLGVPSCAYQVGEATVTKAGDIETEDENLIADLKEYGFDCIVSIDDAIDILKRSSIESVKGEAELTLSFPDKGFDEESFERLKAMTAAKGNLIKHAFKTDIVEINWNKEERTIQFPWFSLEITEDEKLAYIMFLNRLMEAAKTQHRVTAREKDVENEKYAFRCFLLKLGFIGDDFKGARKVLLKNLTGSSAFKRGKEEENEPDR